MAHGAGRRRLVTWDERVFDTLDAASCPKATAACARNAANKNLRCCITSAAAAIRDPLRVDQSTLTT
jgi:hypothetical protein